jgi:hypothetical protein
MQFRSRPLTISASTSCSRTVSRSKSRRYGAGGGSGAAASTLGRSQAGSQVPPRTAALTAATTCSAAAYFATKPTAPARMALIAVAASGYAVSTTTSGADGRVTSCAVRSIPLTRPRRTSMITASGLRAFVMPTTWYGSQTGASGSRPGSAPRMASRPSPNTG